jgi:HD-GYP domain-containing protein (c-di-GMP phosphodiesterase class II)
MDRGKLEKIKTKDLRIGMYVVDVGRSWLHHPWPTRSKFITSTKDISLLEEYGIREVTIDLSRKATGSVYSELGITEETVVQAQELAVNDVAAVQVREPEPLPPDEQQDILNAERRKTPRPDKTMDQVPLDDELPKARKTYSRALETTREMVSGFLVGRKIEVDKVKDNLDEMIDSVFRNRDAMVALIKLQQHDEYTFTHSLNVTVLAMSVGRQVGFTRDQLHILGLGTIFHDLGKFQVPDAILNKPGRLTEEEFEVMKTHPELGARALADQGLDLPEAAFNVIRHHHERSDGSGYPAGLKGDEIDPFMIISALSDVYDALSSDRVYHSAMPPHDALKVVYSLREQHFPQTWTERFVQSVGIYPVGTTVRLSSGEIGVVTAINHASLIHPVVSIGIDRKGRPISRRRTIDLSDENNMDIEIAGIVSSRSYNLNPVSFFSN